MGDHGHGTIITLHAYLLDSGNLRVVDTKKAKGRETN